MEKKREKYAEVIFTLYYVRCDEGAVWIYGNGVIKCKDSPGPQNLVDEEIILSLHYFWKYKIKSVFSSLFSSLNEIHNTFGRRKREGESTVKTDTANYILYAKCIWQNDTRSKM